MVHMGTCSLQQSVALFHRLIPQHQSLTSPSSSFSANSRAQVQLLVQCGCDTGWCLGPHNHSPWIHSLLSQSFSVSLTDSIQQELTWENIYLKQKTLFGCIFKQKINQQNIVSALLKKHLKGNPETSLQYFCFHKVVMEDRKPHKHHYAPIFMNSVRSHAGQGGPSSTGPPDLVTIHQQLMGANMTSLHSSALPPNPKTPTPQSKLFPLPSRQSPHPPEHLVHLLQQEIFGRGVLQREDTTAPAAARRKELGTGRGEKLLASEWAHSTLKSMLLKKGECRDGVYTPQTTAKSPVCISSFWTVVRITQPQSTCHFRGLQTHLEQA